MKRKTKETHPRTEPLDTDKLYQRIGEFVVGFQWIEDKFRNLRLSPYLRWRYGRAGTVG